MIAQRAKVINAAVVQECMACRPLHCLLEMQVHDRRHTGQNRHKAANIGMMLHRCITKVDHNTGNLSNLANTILICKASRSNMLSKACQHVSDEYRVRLPPRGGFKDSAAMHNTCNLINNPLIAPSYSAKYPKHCFERVLLMHHPLQMAPLQQQTQEP